MTVYAVVNRACLYDQHEYEVGEELTSHDVADKLVLLGFAAPSDDVAAAAEPEPSTGDTPDEGDTPTPQEGESPTTKTGRKAASSKE